MEIEKKEALRNHIKQEIQILKQDIAAHERSTGPVSPDNAIGRLTRMDAINNKSIADAAFRAANNKLSKLERMLMIIDTPDFGICRECEEPIPYARLMAVPETGLCVACAESREP